MEEEKVMVVEPCTRRGPEVSQTSLRTPTPPPSPSNRLFRDLLAGCAVELGLAVTPG